MKKTVDQWKAYLEKALLEHRLHIDAETEPLEIIANIFDLTTYDTGLDEYFVGKIMEVLGVIVSNSNYSYINNEDNYKNFIMVLNMGNVPSLIEWGVSIRGADIMHTFKTPWIVDTGLIIVNEGTYAAIDYGEDFCFLYEAMRLFLSDPSLQIQ